MLLAIRDVLGSDWRQWALPVWSRCTHICPAITHLCSLGDGVHFPVDDAASDTDTVCLLTRISKLDSGLQHAVVLEIGAADDVPLVGAEAEHLLSV